jgi:GT2 family glycosyltransferase
MKAIIVICTRNRPFEVVRLLESLLLQEGCEIKYIQIIDSSIHEETELRIVDFQVKNDIPIAYLKVPTSLSLPEKRNIGLRLIKTIPSDYLSFFDDDVVLRPDYLRNLIDAMNKKSALGATGRDISRKKYEVSPLKEWLRIDSKRDGIILTSGVNTGVKNSTTCLEVEWMSGCAMTFATDKISGNYFDERRIFDGEDTDFTFRIAQKGKLIWEPSATYSHKSGTELFSNSNHKVRYHVKHLALAVREFNGRVKFAHVTVFLIFKGILLMLIGMREKSLKGILYGVRYFLSGLCFPIYFLSVFRSLLIHRTSK